MSYFSFTVGSLGDFISIAGILWNLYKSVFKASGATHERHAAVDELHFYQRLVRHLRTQLLDAYESQPELQEWLRDVLDPADALISEVISLSSYNQAMRQEGLGNRIYNAVGWMVYKKREVEELRKRFDRQLGLIAVLLSGSNACVTSTPSSPHLN